MSHVDSGEPHCKSPADADCRARRLSVECWLPKSRAIVQHVETLGSSTMPRGQPIARALSPAVGLGGMALVVLLRLRILRRLRAGALSRRGGKGAALPRRRRTGRKLSGTYCRVNKMR